MACVHGLQGSQQSTQGAAVTRPGIHYLLQAERLETGVLLLNGHGQRRNLRLQTLDDTLDERLSV
jgi:hypothetical protein